MSEQEGAHVPYVGKDPAQGYASDIARNLFPDKKAEGWKGNRKLIRDLVSILDRRYGYVNPKLRRDRGIDRDPDGLIAYAEGRE